jgi:hypothetical protein
MNAMLLTTAATRPVDCDVEKRIVRQAVYATTGLASDGVIALPSGLSLERYLRDPIVTARHLSGAGEADPEDTIRPVVVARTLALQAGELELVAELQFADTADGRDYAHLYGCNPEKTPYMRAYSIEANVLERSSATWTQARVLAGPYWDEQLAERLRRRLDVVTVASRCELKLVALVARGADRAALTRAAREGIRVAGEALARMDLATAEQELAELKTTVNEYSDRMNRLERELRALSGEVASAAAQRNTDALLAELREIRELAARNNTKGS